MASERSDDLARSWDECVPSWLTWTRRALLVVLVWVMAHGI